MLLAVLEPVVSNACLRAKEQVWRLMPVTERDDNAPPKRLGDAFAALPQKRRSWWLAACRRGCPRRQARTRTRWPLWL